MPGIRFALRSISQYNISLQAKKTKRESMKTATKLLHNNILNGISNNQHILHFEMKNS